MLGYTYAQFRSALPDCPLRPLDYRDHGFWFPMASPTFGITWLSYFCQLDVCNVYLILALFFPFCDYQCFRHFTKYFGVNLLRTRTFSYINHNKIPPLNKFNIYTPLMSDLGFIFNIPHLSQ